VFRFDTLQWSQPLCGACDAALAAALLPNAVSRLCALAAQDAHKLWNCVAVMPRSFINSAPDARHVQKLHGRIAQRTNACVRSRGYSRQH
jgi:hypothetical protein